MLETDTEFAFERHITIKEAASTAMAGFYAKVRALIGKEWDLKSRMGTWVDAIENNELPGSPIPSGYAEVISSSWKVVASPVPRDHKR